jgi:hypothetical protein
MSVEKVGLVTSLVLMAGRLLPGVLRTGAHHWGDMQRAGSEQT